MVKIWEQLVCQQDGLILPAVDRSSMSADASRTFSHFRDLKPGPNATGQTGGFSLDPWGGGDVDQAQRFCMKLLK